MNQTIRIYSEHFPGGVLINASEFDPNVHVTFEEGVAGKKKPAGAPKGEGGTQADGGIESGAVDEELLSGTVADVTEVLETIDEVPRLQALRALEVQGKNRAGVLKAIDARLTPSS